ncbi:MAG: SDR family NAD(P)-dependent oxidoreductase [Spirochaetia bacterium]|nr:SDR family NAD(P)-dependent oxidoreductase [Spirochaetia bacterium]
MNRRTADQQVILITGASSGIGEAAASRLLAQGYIVYGAARRTERMAALAERGLIALPLDITDDRMCTEVVDTIMQEQGRIDVLINNAGYGSYGSVEDVPMDEAKRQFEVNLFGLARITQLVLPVMRAQKSGRIINISSIGGKMALPFGAWYHATKHALEGFSDSLRLEAAPFGISVVLIEPGGIRSEWDSIAVASLLKHSDNDAYGNEAQGFASYFSRMYKNPRTSGPDAVARSICRAVTAARPKTRYVSGHLAPTILLLRRILTDRAFDRLMYSQLHQ